MDYEKLGRLAYEIRWAASGYAESAMRWEDITEEHRQAYREAARAVVTEACAKAAE